jgi:2-polyprenyl-6-methoxyphenol hydroxylase-like FAD-dependent oxidoreductase
MAGRDILISGAGIAGPALAHCLLRQGFVPTLVERAPALRQGGYMIDFWGVGYDVAERMGLLPRLMEVGYRMGEIVFVDGKGRRVSGFGGKALRRSIGERFISLQRGDLARAIYDRLQGRVETIFGDCVQTIVERGDKLAITFEKSPPRYFDLAIGADGLHSAVRRIAFGPETSFRKYLGYWTGSFVADGYPHRTENAYVSRAAPGRQMSRYALKDGRSAFFFVFTQQSDTPPAAPEAQKAIVAERFADDGWELPQILACLERTDDLYLDAVSQVRMPRWSSGRVALLGDAAYCPSLLAGEGAAFAMAGAYILAGELGRAADHRAGFAAYEARFRGFIEGKQKSARQFAHAFAPRTALGLMVRNLVLELMAVPPVAQWMMRRFVRDEFPLPDYRATGEEPTS